MLNLAVIHEAIAAAIPDRECIVFRDRRLRWRDVTDRSRRLADVLRRHGLGCRTERAALAPWESGQDHVALYLYNGNEYLEGMLGAAKARAASFNVNYRYVDEELVYLFGNAQARAVVYHAAFAETLERIRPQLCDVRLWLQVDDDSGAPLLPGALDYESALAQAEPAPPGPELSPDDLYVLYTGGTTGMPKGVLWRQQDIICAALDSARARRLDAFVERARGRGIRALPAPPLMHGASQWVTFNMWHVGGTIVLQSEPRHLDPHDLWSTVEREQVHSLTIVGDAYARPLLDQLDVREYDLSSLKIFSSGGAILTAKYKDEVLRRLPHVRVMDSLGSSETGAQGVQLTQSGSRARTGDFAMNPDNTVLTHDLAGLAGPGEEGWLARSGHVPLGYYRDAEKTQRTFPVVDGVRYAVPGDRAIATAEGGVTLLGRDSVTINTGGEKVFAEEVEHALKHHPAVYDVVVVGTPSERWGQQVTALVVLRDGQPASEDALREAARAHIAGYKVPKAFVFLDALTRAPSGKPDYRWARATALRELGIEG